MFKACTHEEIVSSLESIDAAFAIFELHRNDALLISANSRFEEIIARPLRECIGRPVKEFVPAQIAKQIRPCLLLCQVKKCPQETEFFTEHGEKKRWWRFLVSSIISDGTQNRRMIAAVIEITEKKTLQEGQEVSQQRHAALIDSARDGILTIDQNQMVKMINHAARRIFKVATDDSAVGAHLSRFISRRTQNNHVQHVDLFRMFSGNAHSRNVRAPIYGLQVDGNEIEIEVTLSKIKIGKEAEMAVVIRDISDHVKLIDQLKQAAARDSLTGIFNRRHGAAVLNSEIYRSKRYGFALAVAMLDIDHFKAINDTYGHACGDLVLNSFVATISKTLRVSDTICRWGGEEFLVVLPAATSDGAQRWAERAREAVASLSTIGDGEQAIKITASFGVASMLPRDLTLEDLLKRTDEALYRAKTSGRNQVIVAQD